MPFRWEEPVDGFDDVFDLAWFEVEFSLRDHGPRHKVRVAGIDGNNGPPPPRDPGR